MQLVIRDSTVIAVHPEHTIITDEQYPVCDVVDYEGIITEVPCDDPRTEEEKEELYRSKRRRKYPKIGDQLDMIYWDHVNGTTTWWDTIAWVKSLFPKT